MDGNLTSKEAALGGTFGKNKWEKKKKTEPHVKDKRSAGCGMT